MTLVQRLAQTAADLVGSQHPRVLVGIDGPDAAGKTTLADALADATSVPVVRASVDGFHQPASRRHARGALSPEGYYRDSFDDAALRSHLLEPFAAGAGTVDVRVFDHRLDVADIACVEVSQRAMLLVDGVFLLRPELRDLWSLSVYLHVDEEVSVARARRRDVGLFMSLEELELRYRQRYLPGQALYRAEADPQSHADIVIDNSRPALPTVLRWATAR